MTSQWQLDSVPPTLKWPLSFCAVTIAATYILSVITNNVSQVDRLWSITPSIYTAYFAFLPLWPNHPLIPLLPYTPPDVGITKPSPRALLAFGLTVLWMIRLSYNTWRRGLYNPGEEDYRWAILRSKMSPFVFQLFNLSFIATLQNIILFLLTLPAFLSTLQSPTLLPSDILLASLALLTLFLEFTADNQQYSYQTFKHSGNRIQNDWVGARIAWTAADAKRGFVSRGLWAWSRHPNFLAEQTFWILLNFFPLLGGPLPTLPYFGRPSPLLVLTPSFVLCTLFFFSARFSEALSRPKYPAYAAYQRRVALFVPVLTPVWGLWVKMAGDAEEVDKVVFGQDEGKKE